MAFPDAMVRTLYPAGRDIDIYLPWSLSCVRWSVSGKRASPKLRPLIAREPPACRAAWGLRAASPPRQNLAELGPIAQPRFDDDGDPAIADKAKPVAQSLYLCTFAAPPWPSCSGRGAPAPAPVVQRLPLLSSFARLASLVPSLPLVSWPPFPGS